MLVLAARRLDNQGQEVEFKIFAPGRAPITTNNVDQAASALTDLGIRGATNLLAEACERGVIEIPEPD